MAKKASNRSLKPPPSSSPTKTKDPRQPARAGGGGDGVCRAEPGAAFGGAQPLALERAVQPDARRSSRWAAAPIAASCSTCRRPRPTCRRCWSASGCKRLIEQGKTTSLRGLYYMLKHTIEGTKEETFDEQDESDTIIEDVEVTLNALREELHLYAKNARRRWSGRSRSIDSGDEIDCTRMGSRRLQHSLDRRAGSRSSSRSATPSSSCTSKRTRSGGGSTKTSSGRSTTAFSRTAAASRRAACGGCCNRLHNELKLPVYCLLDNDPWGYYIYSVLKQGSINLAYEIEADGDPRRQATSACGATTTSAASCPTACRSS